MRLCSTGILACVSSFLLIFLGTVAADAQIANFQHVVVIVQENRTPDNLFQGLCSFPYGLSILCSTSPNGSQYDIQVSNWLDKKSPGGTIQPGTVPLANAYDLSHAHSAFVNMCDADPVTGVCKMDGASGVTCSGTCPATPQFRYVDNSTGILNPYLEMATHYGWANYMFQTNQGPSFPAHQFLFGGTSAPSTADDAAGVFASENMSGVSQTAGCTAAAGTTVQLIDPRGENQKIYPCFEHQTMGDLLSSFSWRYYAPSAGSIWTAPNAINHICQSTGPGGKCIGPDWTNNVDLTPADVLRDVANCNLRSVSWVIPAGQNSDHARGNDGGGPSWVASIVNAIGGSTACDNHSGYWNNTAILITWDDWGGWYDHEPPTILAPPEGDYQYGFRVPLLVVSAYTPAGYINNNRHDFGSILRFIEQNFGVREGALHFADSRAKNDLTGFFDLTRAPRAFQTISAPKTASFFLRDKRKATDPDDQWHRHSCLCCIDTPSKIPQCTAMPWWGGRPRPGVPSGDDPLVALFSSSVSLRRCVCTRLGALDHRKSCAHRGLSSDLVLVQNVSKLYRLYRRPADRLRELFPGSRPRHTDFWALRDIGFAVEKGEALGVVGPNGCGKSTLLQIVSGILPPTHGRVVTRGRIAALLELGAGFNPEFSGRENVYLNGEILGLSRAAIDKAMPSIEAFAEIGEFIERPVKEYSSGMYVRLAFSTAIHVDPEILIVDEALAVGDAVFANRCVRKFQELRERKITVLFVSHDLGLVKQLSDRAILLLHGRIEAEGAPKDVINRYIGLVLAKQGPLQRKEERVRGSFRHGDGASEILRVAILNARGEEVTSVASGEAVTVRVRSRFHQAKSDPMVGILIRTRIGMDVYGTNTCIENTRLGDFRAGDELEVDFHVECWLTPQPYTLTVATQNPDGSSHDWLDDAIAFDVVDTRVAAGVANLRAKVEWRVSR